MKLVILAGGLGTRIAEETHLRPKPMIEIGSKPILWHIMKIYSYYGVNDFIICCGYKGYIIKEYFANYFLHMSDITIDLTENSIEVHEKKSEPWRVTMVDTGDETQTGGRLKRVSRFLGAEPFCMTYGDGLADIRIDELVNFHRTHGKCATVTAVTPPGRYGALDVRSNRVEAFVEKPKGDGGRINGGFFVLDPIVLDLIKGDEVRWEVEPMEQLVSNGELMAYQHDGFWQPMDTLRDKHNLESLWAQGQAPWKVWEQ